MVWVQTETEVKLNFGLSPDFSIQIKVSLSERLSERLSQKLKSTIGMWSVLDVIYLLVCVIEADPIFCVAPVWGWCWLEPQT